MVFNLKESGRSMATVILGAVGTVLAAVGVAGNFEDFLHFLEMRLCRSLLCLLWNTGALGKEKQRTLHYVKDGQWLES